VTPPAPVPHLTLETGTDGHAKQSRGGVLRVEATDVDDGMRAVERVLGVTAKKWHLRSTTPNGGKTIVLEYECRLRRAYTLDAVRAQVLDQGAPFVRLAEWNN